MTSPAGFGTKRNRSKVTRGKSRYAFTLVELMVVLAIVVVFAGTVATVRFGTRGSLAVEYEAPRLLSILKLCRERSLQTGRVHRLAIDREARQFWIEWEVDPLDGKGTFEPFSDGGRTRHEWEEDVSWLEVSFDEPTEIEPDAEEDESIDYLYFNTDGTARSTRIVLQGGDQKRVLVIDSFTGRTTILTPKNALDVFNQEADEDREYLVGEESN